MNTDMDTGENDRCRSSITEQYSCCNSEKYIAQKLVLVILYSDHVKREAHSFETPLKHGSRSSVGLPSGASIFTCPLNSLNDELPKTK